MFCALKESEGSSRFLVVANGVRTLLRHLTLCHCGAGMKWISASFLLVSDGVLILAILQEAKISFPSHSAGCDQEESPDWG